MKTQKERLEEAYNIHSRFHNYLGYLVCDGEEDMLALRKLVKKLQRETINNFKKKVKKKLYEDDYSGWRNIKYVNHIMNIVIDSIKEVKNGRRQIRKRKKELKKKSRED